MLDALKWLAYAVPVSAIGIGCLWAFSTQMSSTLGEQVRKLQPPYGVRLAPASRQAIFDELYRRRRHGFRVAVVFYVLVIVAFHPMYAPDRLSDESHAAAWSGALLFGFAIGETYAAATAARTPRPVRRLASLTPRSASTYLAPFERIAQGGLLCALVSATAFLTIATVSIEQAAWMTYALWVSWAWLLATLGAIGAQRWVLAQPPPLDDERDLIVREYVTASAMQQLHKAIWCSGLLAYSYAIGYALGSQPTGAELAIGYGPPVAVLFGVIGLWRWRQLPDPVWHFARTSGSPA